MAEEKPNIEKRKKLLALLGSENENEALAALRKLKTEVGNWNEFVNELFSEQTFGFGSGSFFSQAKRSRQQYQTSANSWADIFGEPSRDMREQWRREAEEHQRKVQAEHLREKFQQRQRAAEANEKLKDFLNSNAIGSRGKDFLNNLEKNGFNAWGKR